MKKCLLVVLLAILICLASCENSNGHYEKIEYEIVEKYTAVESHYNFIFDSYKTETAYYIVLSNGQTIHVSQNEYGSYQIGDSYILNHWVEDPKEAD